MIVDGLRTWMLAQASISNLVGTRVYATQAPQRATLPHVVLTRTGEDKYGALDGTGGNGQLAAAELDIECKAATPAAATALAAAVCVALKDATGTMGSVTCEAVIAGDEFDDYEPATDGSDNGRHVTTLEFTIQYK